MSDQFCDPNDGGCGERFFGGHVCKREPSKPVETATCAKFGCDDTGWTRLAPLIWVKNCKYCGREMDRDEKEPRRVK